MNQPLHISIRNFFGMRKSRNSLRVGISLSLRITFFTGGLFSVRRNSFGGSAVAANFLSYRNDTHSRFISVIRQTVSSGEGNATRRRESRTDRIGGRFPGNMRHTGPLYSPRRVGCREGHRFQRPPLGYPNSGYHGVVAWKL